jgi:hypothetical protein
MFPEIYAFPSPVCYAEALAKTYNKHTGNTVRIDKSSKKTVSAFIEAMIKKGYGAGNKRDE